MATKEEKKEGKKTEKKNYPKKIYLRWFDSYDFETFENLNDVKEDAENGDTILVYELVDVADLISKPQLVSRNT